MQSLLDQNIAISFTFHSLSLQFNLIFALFRAYTVIRLGHHHFSIALAFLPFIFEPVLYFFLNPLLPSEYPKKNWTEINHFALETYQVEKNEQSAALQNSENHVSLRYQVCLFSFIWGIDFIMKVGPDWMAKGVPNTKGSARNNKWMCLLLK